MSTLAPKHVINFCGVQIIVFCARATGDGLPLHDHPFDHLSLALGGTPEAFYADGTVQIMYPGDAPLKFTTGQQHGVRATAPGDCFVNIMPLPNGA